jgi:hypothetical protein
MRFRATMAAGLVLALSALLLNCTTQRISKEVTESIADEWLPGKSVAALQKALGPPDTLMGNLLLYRKHGMLVYMDPMQIHISSVVGTWFPGVGRFSGSLLSLRLGDPYPLVEKRLGPPLSRYPLHPGIDEAEWKVGGFHVKIEIWLKDDFEPDLGGTIYAETVKRIQVG